MSTGVGWRKVVDVDGCWMKESCCCRRVLDEGKLLLSTGVGWRVLEKSSLDCSGGGFGSFFFFWATVEVECLDLDIGDDNANISSSLPESYASSPRSELWPVMCFISHSGNPKDFNFRTVVFLAESFVIFLFAHNSANGDFFSFCSTLCLLYWPPWLDFYTKHQSEVPIFRNSTGRLLLNN